MFILEFVGDTGFVQNVIFIETCKIRGFIVFDFRTSSLAFGTSKLTENFIFIQKCPMTDLIVFDFRTLFLTCWDIRTWLKMNYYHFCTEHISFIVKHQYDFIGMYHFCGFLTWELHLLHLGLQNWLKICFLSKNVQWQFSVSFCILHFEKLELQKWLKMWFYWNIIFNFRGF